MRPLPAIACVICLSIALALPVAAAPPVADGPPAMDDRWEPPSVVHQVEENATNESNNTSTVGNATQTIRIDVQHDGSARISIVWIYPAGNEDERAAFDRLAGEFEQGQLESARTVSVFERIVEDVEQSSNRSHSIENVSRSSAVVNESGELQLTFTWVGFARQDGNELYVDDVFLIGNSTWLPSLSEGQRLVINAPIGYAVDLSPASVSNGSVRWDGPTTFEPGEIEFVYVPREPDVSQNGNGGGNGGPIGQFSTLTVILAVALLGTLLLLAALLIRRGDRFPFDRPPRQAGDGGATPMVDGDGGADAIATDEDRPVSESDQDDPFAGIDPDLLSDEERVIRLLKANDARMKQATIVKETRWSNAKVSQLLSAMAEDGTIEKLRIGRENLITLIEDDGNGDGGSGRL